MFGYYWTKLYRKSIPPCSEYIKIIQSTITLRCTSFKDDVIITSAESKISFIEPYETAK